MDAKKVVGISLMKGNYHLNNSKMINDYGFINKINYEKIKDEYLELYLVRLDKVKDIVYAENERRFIKWLRFIKASDFKEMEKISEGDDMMEQALKFMKRFVNDEKNLSIFDSIKDRERNAREKGIAEGRKEGLEAGEALGRLDEKRKTAMNMLNKGFSVQDISDLTSLTIEEIETINLSK